MWSGVRHFFKPRLTLKYPEQKLDLQGQGYQFDAKAGVGRPGFKGRHVLLEDKCTGCQLCAIACDGVAVAIDMQELSLKRTHNKKDIWPAVDYGRCVPHGTPVVTSEGIVPIEKVQAGDLVLTHRGRFRAVTEVFTRKYTGRMYRFKTLGNPEILSVTEGHPVMIYSGNGTKWVNPEAVQCGTYLTRPVICEVKQIPFLEYAYDLYHPAGRGGYFTVERVALEFTPELARLLGYYLAEGNTDRHAVTFDIHKEEEALASDIVRCVEDVFSGAVSFEPDKRSDGLKLSVDSVRIAAFFEQFGSMCDRKQLPGWAMVAPLELQAEIIRTAYWGDGHYSNKYYSYKHAMHSNLFVIRTTSRVLANQYSYILNRLGILASISINHQKDRKDCYLVTIHSPYIEKMGELVNVRAENSPPSHGYIRMTEDIIASPVVTATFEDVADEEVWNLEVQDDNSYVAANNIVHNCVFCGLCVDACPFDALVMTNEYELAAYDRASLKYTPEMLFVPPEPTGKYKVKIDPERGTAKHG